MTSIEVFKGLQKASERTYELAAESGNRKALDAANFLIRYVGDAKPLPREAYREILAQERSRTRENFLKARESGLANDKESLGVGLTALVIEGPEPFFDSRGDTSRYGEDFSIEQVGEVEGAAMHAIELPSGVYEEIDTGIGIRFYIKGKADGLGRIRGEIEDMFILELGSVVRIVGYEGELWQNSDRNPDGTPTEELLRRREIYAERQRH